MNTINREKAALVLVEATYFSDATVAKNWGISQKTIYNHRKRLDTDSELAEIYQLKKKSLNAIGEMV